MVKSKGNLTVYGSKELHQMLLTAPKAILNGAEHWMWKERKLFVGNKGSTGTFRRSLKRKKKKYSSGTWSGAIGQAFTGSVKNRGNSRGMYLEMGVIDKWRKRIPYVDILAKGGTVRPKSGKWMLIPNYKNLRDSGVRGRIGSSSGSKMNWTRWRKQNQGSLMAPFVHNGKLYIFAKGTSGSPDSKYRRMGLFNKRPLFIGVKKATIKKQFDFVKAFDRRIPGMVKRFDKRINKVIDKLNSGKTGLE